MASNALEVLSLDDAKLSLDIPLEATDRDARITSVIRQAVAYVSSLTDPPLVMESTRYALEVINDTIAKIDAPFGIVMTSIEKLGFQAETNSVYTTVDNDFIPRENIFHQVTYDFGLQSYVISSTAFQYSKWPDMINPYIEGSVVLSMTDARFYRLKSAVELVVHALMANEPIPTNVRMLVNGRVS